MRRKLYLGAGTLAVLALALAGCGAPSTPASSSGATIASTMIFGGPAEFKTRVAGLAGITTAYGVTFGKFTVTDTGGPVTVQALKNGQIDAADLFSTDPSIAANDFVMLTDPKSVFAAQNIVPIISKAKASPGVTAILNAIMAKLSTTSLADMVAKVQNDKQDPAAVAAAWLTANGLDGKSTSASGAALTVGSADFAENVLLAEIFAQALSNAGATISKKLNIGSREKYFPALEAGSLDLFPEYTGTVLTYLKPTATESSPTDVYAALGKVLPPSLIALNQSDAQDTDVIAVTRATADKYHLVSIEDLAQPAK